MRKKEFSKVSLLKGNIFFVRVVFNWVPWNQNQSYHSDQSEDTKCPVNQSKLQASTCGEREAPETAIWFDFWAMSKSSMVMQDQGNCE